MILTFRSEYYLCGFFIIFPFLNLDSNLLKKMILSKVFPFERRYDVLFYVFVSCRKIFGSNNTQN
ncbi:hypothetical protein LEP1GSC192_0510 [Leptospira sp. B5-022]|nr:hypothetical protein LEP1GSC192_0510 [Leptospira sp. B5-022]